jgi:hypothetical protein
LKIWWNMWYFGHLLFMAALSHSSYTLRIPVSLGVAHRHKPHS